jgi:hypothetical protein
MEEPKGEGSDRTETILPNFSRRNIEDFQAETSSWNTKLFDYPASEVGVSPFGLVSSLTVRSNPSMSMGFMKC